MMILAQFVLVALIILVVSLFRSVPIILLHEVISETEAIFWEVVGVHHRVDIIVIVVLLRRIYHPPGRLYVWQISFLDFLYYDFDKITILI